jgi:hypothetical protein
LGPTYDNLKLHRGLFFPAEALLSPNQRIQIEFLLSGQYYFEELDAATFWLACGWKYCNIGSAAIYIHSRGAFMLEEGTQETCRRDFLGVRGRKRDRETNSFTSSDPSSLFG